MPKCRHWVDKISHLFPSVHSSHMFQYLPTSTSDFPAAAAEPPRDVAVDWFKLNQGDTAHSSRDIDGC